MLGGTFKNFTFFQPDQSDHVTGKPPKCDGCFDVYISKADTAIKVSGRNSDAQTNIHSGGG